MPAYTTEPQRGAHLNPSPELPMGKGNKTQKREVKKPKQDKKNPKPPKK